MISLNELHLCLDALEEQEAELLSWGDTGAFFTRDELIILIERVSPKHEPEELLIELEKHAMLLRVPLTEGQYAYRTRMGESVHLFRNLRQWFYGKSLDEARTLVSDFRFVRRQRSYPERKYLPEQLLNDWNETISLTSTENSTLKSLLEPLEKFRLAGFQVRATERIIKAWRYHSRQKSMTSTGTIICAGTGSGKTLSFYLPALTALTEDLLTDSTPRVRILAIYPRKELLKDQFMETWAQCRKLDTQIQKKIGRKIRIGSFFGDTPLTISSALDDVRKSNENQFLPYDLLRCKDDGCKGHMRWSRSDLESGKEELCCSICAHRIGSDEVGLTRDSLTKLMPDILFTTTEMLNQHLGNHYQNKLFGVGQISGPVLVLLDEVHTYGGNAGAQTAYLLRRWMQRSFCRPHFVGLSATLSDASNFFAELVGANQQHVELVEPKSEELVDEGAEYLLAIRGDPVSQTALLSTTIQASMLTRRLLDNNEKISKGTWGSKTFVFTDDLDGNNRLYHQLADAEGWVTSYRGLKPKSTPPLASLRGMVLKNAEQDQRVILGQDWCSTSYIGHTLDENDRAKVSRTSSQDSGVDAQSEIVIATSSLEVGFNDPQVGAVIQHKAPREVASYLQRKGRAGRSRTMRPWMIIVLSEFGRDRVAFQRYEDLLSPEIKRQGLPLKNGHIQKMQAAMTVLDWLSMKLGYGSIWTILNKPQGKSKECGQLLKLLQDLINPGEQQDAFIQYIKYSLKFEEEELLRALWSPPRSIMMEFIPSLKRLIETNWREYGADWSGLRPTRSPMPAFIPDALFSELNLPRLNIALKRGRESINVWESLSFYQALREFAPGRISKRYAINSNFDADWLIPSNFKPDVGKSQSIDFEIHEAFGNNLTDEGQVTSGDGNTISVFRPQQIFTTSLNAAFRLNEKSNARLKWKVQFSTPDQVHVFIPPNGSWSKSLKDVTFFAHRHMTQLEIIRFNTASKATLNFKNGGEKTTVSFNWVQNEKTVAVGARQWVDGMRLRFGISESDIQNILEDENILSGLRPVYFRYLVSKLKFFDEDPFTAGWISECYLAALAELLCLNGGTGIKDALKLIASDVGLERLLSIPDSLFQPDDPEYFTREQELQVRLRELLINQELLSELFGCAESLWQDVKLLVNFEEWIKTLLGNTLSAAIIQTLCTLFPDVDEQAVVADYIWTGNELSLWVSESEPGGSGVITRLSDSYFEDPIRVLSVFVRNLQAGDYEQIDYDLFAMLNITQEGGDLADALLCVRSASEHRQRRDAIMKLHFSLQGAGFAITHSFLSVLHSRVLRPGSNKETDSILLSLLTQWKNLERDSGIEWPINIASHALASKALGKSADIQKLFKSYCKTQSLLWPRGYITRQSELSYYSSFQGEVTVTERLLGAKLFSDETPSVEFSNDNWLEILHKHLCKDGRVDLHISREQVDNVTDAITRCQLEPVDNFGLLLFPRISSLRRINGEVILRIELAESLQ